MIVSSLVDCTQEVTCPDGTTTVVVEGKNRCYFVSDLTAESWMNAQVIIIIYSYD